MGRGKARKPRDLSADARRNAFAEKHMNLVTSIARGLSRKLPRHINVDDLVSDGMLGLLDAADRYDPSLGWTFGTFARLKIRGAIIDGMRRVDALPRYMRSLDNQLTAANAALEHELGRTPTTAELASRLGISVVAVDKIQRRHTAIAIVSLDATKAGRPPIADKLPSQDPDPETLLSTAEQVAQMSERIERALIQLPMRLQLVLSMRFAQGLGLIEIGEIIGVTESRASQLVKEAVGLMRGLMVDRGEA